METRYGLGLARPGRAPYGRYMTSNGGDNGGFKGLFGTLAKAIGGAFVEGLEGQMREHLTAELSKPNLRERNKTAMRLRVVLSRPEFALTKEISAQIEAELKSALASANAKKLVVTLGEAVRTSGWKSMQRLMFYQLVAPHPGVSVDMGNGSASVSADVDSGAGQTAPGQNLPPKPPAADRPDYLRMVRSVPDEDEDEDDPTEPTEDAQVSSTAVDGPQADATDVTGADSPQGGEPEDTA